MKSKTTIYKQNDNIIYILSNNGIVGEEDNNHFKRDYQCI